MPEAPGVIIAAAVLATVLVAGGKVVIETNKHVVKPIIHHVIRPVVHVFHHPHAK